jgi:hypothetical protein
MTWQPMRRGTLIVPAKTRELAKTDQVAAERIDRSDEVWLNDRYTVIVYRRQDGTVECLSIRRNDRGAVRDWRHMQKIKNELAGPETEAFQIFPAESRLVDSANQTWLWVLRPGMQIPAGFTERSIGSPEEAAAIGARQRDFEEGIAS